MSDQDEIVHSVQQQRTDAWENDFSMNALDDQPFENLPPISERIDSEIVNHQRLLPIELLGDRDLPALAKRDTAPIPCPPDREGYYPGYDGQYWMSGLSDLLKVQLAASQHDVELNRCLDFGCTSARFIRHLCFQTAAQEIWGSEINRRHVRWLSRFMPKIVKPVFISAIPSLPIPDARIDAVTAFSVFTHIDAFETGWLSELWRVLRPGGLAYVTVYNEDVWSRLNAEAKSNVGLLNAMRTADPNSDQKIRAALPAERSVFRHRETGPYRSQVFHSNKYLHEVWGRFFEIHEIIPAWHERHSVIVMTKPS